MEKLERRVKIQISEFHVDSLRTMTDLEVEKNLLTHSFLRFLYLHQTHISNCPAYSVSADCP